VNELLLQADRMRRDDDPALLVGAGGFDGRHEIGKRLADAGARLDHEMLAARDGGGDGVGHLQLL
jgi:hypothetical protein